MKIIENVRKKCPLVHCITNYVTVNDVANIILAGGASPIMADDKNEVIEMQTICSALVVNIGTLNERTIEAMVLAGKTANECNHPVVLDPVGVGASKLRTETTFRLLKEIKFEVIRGNISEIKVLALGYGKTSGVDACEADKVTDDNLVEVINFAKKLSKKTGAIITITGEIDIICNEEKAYITKNGHELMGKVTGTGCMLTGLIAAYVAANQERKLDATLAAVSAMGLCGEFAIRDLKANQGTGSLRVGIIDQMSLLTDELLKDGNKIETR